jgi:hypothetical protein
LNHGHASLVLLPQSLLNRTGQEAFDLLKGAVLVDSSERKLRFEFPHARLEVSPASKVKFLRKETGVEVQVLSGSLTAQAKGQREVLNFPAGYKANLEWLDARGEMKTDLPSSLTKGEWVTLFYDFYQDLPPSKIKERLAKDMRPWRQAVETASQIQGDYVRRELAAEKSRQEAAARRKAQIEAEDRKLRALFREKNYL